MQQSKPQEVVLPDEPVVLSESEFMMAAAALQDSHHVGNAMVTKFVRQESTDSGWDNPFRPGGDLSREADEIVELIKGGKPITPTSAGNASPLPPSADERIDSNQTSTPITESPKKANATALSATPKTAKNGNVQNDAKSPLASPPGKKGVSSPGKNEFDVQRGHTVAAGDASQVEHVVIKKKPKCKCCVIQ